MATSVRSPWPQQTTFWVGLCLAVSGLLEALLFAHLSLGITKTFSVAVPGEVLGALAAIARAAGFVLAAVGMRGEIGIAADSRLGRAALIVFGVRDLVFVLLGLVVPAPLEGEASLVLVAGNTAFTVLAPAAGLVGAVLVVRAGVLGGIARWALLPVALVDLAFVALQYLPLGDLRSSLALLPVEFAGPVLLVALGAAYLLHGRVEAVKHRAAVIEQHW